MDNSLKHVDVTIDGKQTIQNMATSFDVSQSFKINLPDDYRVNVIGYTNNIHKNEKGIIIAFKDMVQRFAIDKKKRQYRIEIYHDKRFCGMLIVNFRS